MAAQILLFLPILLGYWYAHSELAVWVQWVPDMFSARPFRLTGVLLGAILCGLLAGIIFSAPVKLLFRRRSVLAGAAISLIAAAFDAYHIQFSGQLPFTQVALSLDLIVLFLALPLVVFVLDRLRPNNSFKPTPLRGAA
ncbi:hypothetical protein [Marilutibacter alkalisoli]|uniref:Uncharacterized protein n=1 Tax=Marilutibacter alkalisoli TaxID=2591633 RepID=A0A514BQM7_9GAMM|nr:hypothetical protein [Lysobacter alkalisoli]QDH69702.1 hypothetical protein FKV23_06025 [Lysobacter alkalisoli]